MTFARKDRINLKMFIYPLELNSPLLWLYILAKESQGHGGTIKSQSICGIFSNSEIEKGILSSDGISAYKHEEELEIFRCSFSGKTFFQIIKLSYLLIHHILDYFILVCLSIPNVYVSFIHCRIFRIRVVIEMFFICSLYLISNIQWILKRYYFQIPKENFEIQ